MRVLAAKFPDRERASDALGRLYRRLPLDPVDVDIAPLGVPGEQAESATILAGRFPESLAPEVSRVVHETGGQIVADVDEQRTRPRTSGRREEQRELVANR